MIVWFFTNLLTDPAGAGLGLRSVGKSVDHHPSVKIRLMDDATEDATQMNFLELFGAPLGIVGNWVHEMALSGEVLPKEIICLPTELGGEGKIRPWVRGFAYSGMKACLRDMGILPSNPDLPEPEHRVRFMNMQMDENHINAYKDGMFEPRVNLGEEVEDGQFAGDIWLLKEPRLAQETWYSRKGGSCSANAHQRTARSAIHSSAS